MSKILVLEAERKFSLMAENRKIPIQRGQKFEIHRDGESNSISIDGNEFKITASTLGVLQGFSRVTAERTPSRGRRKKQFQTAIWTGNCENLQDFRILSKLNWEIVVEDAFSRGVLLRDKAVFRDDTNTEIGRVGPNFGLVTVSETLDLIERLRDAASSAYVGGGFFRDGSEIYAQISLGDFEIAGKKHSSFAFISNAFDGSRKLSVRLGDVRIVCRNTFLRAIREGEEFFKIRHGSKISEKIADFRQLIDSLVESNRGYYKRLNALADCELNPEMLRVDYIEQLLPMRGKTEAAQKNRQSQQDRLNSLIFEGVQHTGRPTALDAFNAVTQFANFELRSDSTESERLENLAYGPSSKFIDEAWNRILQIAKVS